MSFNVINASAKITEQYRRYLKTIFDIAQPEYKQLFNEQLESADPFSKGPYLDVTDSFVKGQSVSQLVDNGVLSSEFKRLPDIYDKTLYLHQQKAIEKTLDGKNIVVSTGTGSGKTECFLIPIINHLMREKEIYGEIKPGVRALLIYPMNALANDQIDRLRRTLAKYHEITFGSYTGQTEYKKEKALEIYKKINTNPETGEVPVRLENELLSREEMKETPPNILITNYAMLEYLMLRPEDSVFFEGKHAHSWKFIVLDEAHTYTGSTGIEVSMLMRRVMAKLHNPQIQYILTSATLGDESSNDKVVEFAENLCSASFCADDVIRAYRVNLREYAQEKYKLGTDFYTAVHDLIDCGYEDSYILQKIYESFGIVSKDYSLLPEFLYDLMLQDEIYWKVKEFLASPCSVSALCSELNWTFQQLSDFVDVASRAIKDRTKIFDARYHLFIRATEGVFITLPPYKSLSLTRKNYEHHNGKDYKVFEVVTCSQCHALYILGNIEDNHLVQKSNYDSQNIKEAFYIGEVTNDDDEENQLASEDLTTSAYELCPYCGYIRPANEVHKKACEHGSSDYIKLIKVKTSKVTGRVTKCVCCESVNRLGILRSFFTGQEASTSVIGTALFEQLPGYINKVETPVETTTVTDDGFDEWADEVTQPTSIKVPKAKQFIAFSDSRQAAAYFASYFSETYDGILYSSLINAKIKSLGTEQQPIPRFVAELATIFRNNNISPFTDDSRPDYEAEAWVAVLKELVENKTRNSLAGLGLLSLSITDDDIFMQNKKYGFSAEDVKNICLNFIAGMLTESAIYYKKTLSESDILFFAHGGVETSYLLHGGNDRSIHAFIPKNNSRTNKRKEYLERILKSKGIVADSDSVNNLLSAFWDKFLLKYGLLKNITNKNGYEGYRVNTEKLTIGNAKKWYRCPRCQRLTPFNVSGVCPSYMCDGVLEPVDADELNRDNHYYKIYNELEPHSLRIVEHTAQLNRDEAYKYQNLFKQKKIDVLSCSTTFEMGVDVGELETVFMRNMPPTPSNYAQRAGRAGRSTHSAAFALTFCTKSNHDFIFFKNPVSMIKGTITPPVFKTDNEKICIRHVYASALSFFWKKYPQYFSDAHAMMEVDGKKKSGFAAFKEYLLSKPSDLKKYLKLCLPQSLIKQFKIETFGWVRWLFDAPNVNYPNFNRVFEMYNSEISTLQTEKEKADAAGNKSDYITYQIKNYRNEKVISFLSKNSILPKYGFPVDTVQLRITDKNDSAAGLDLSRDLSMAISEYAPGCQIVANGRLITSRYIRKIPHEHWKMYDYIKCEDCQTLNMDIHTEYGSQLKECRQCGAILRENQRKTFLIPDFGFIAEHNISTPTLIKPERTSRTEAAFVNYDHHLPEKDYIINGLKVQTAIVDNGPMAILTTDEFFVCQKCGYACETTETGTPFLKMVVKPHTAPSGKKCSCSNLERFSLGYRFETDVIRIRINKICSFEQAYSVLQAIILSACAQLNIDNTEIAGCLQYCTDGVFYYVLYDTTPGGAGHVKRLNSKEMIEKVLLGAYVKAKNCTCGGEEGDSSCYSCLRTYQNQRHHDIIKRKYVVAFLSEMNELE